jgi:hypothetical protein
MACTRQGIAPCRTRTYNPLIKSTFEGGCKSLSSITSGDLAKRLDCALTNAQESKHELAALAQSDRRANRKVGGGQELDHELARVVEAWPSLPGSLREAILKLIG